MAGERRTYVYRASTQCGNIYCSDADWADARDGLGSLVVQASTSSDKYIGISTVSPWLIYQLFLRFDTSGLPDDAVVTAAALRLTADSRTPTYPTLHVRSYDYGATLDTTDFRSKAQLEALQLLGTHDTNTWTQYAEYNIALSDPSSLVNLSGYTYLLIHSDAQLLESAPGDNGYASINLIEAALYVEYSVSGKSYVYCSDGAGAGAESGTVQCADADYADARSGAGSKSESHPGYLYLGQELYSGNYFFYESFLRFDTSFIPDGDEITAVVLRTVNFGSYSGPATTFKVWARDWGGTLETTDFVAGADLSGLTLAASLASSGWGAAPDEWSSESAFAAAINKTGYTLLLLGSARQENGDVPTGNEYARFYAYESELLPKLCELEIIHEAGTVDDDLPGSHRLMAWAAADDLDGSHGIIAYLDDDLDGSHKLWGWAQDNLDGSHRLMNWAAADDLDGSHRLLVWAAADDLPGSHFVVGVDDLTGSHRLLVLVDSDLDGSHRVLVWSDDDLSGAHTLVPAGVPAAAPPLLYVPQLSLLLDDANSVPLDLIAEGADPSSVRFSNSVIGGHGRLSVEFPHRPSQLAVNGLHRGMDAALFDRGHKLHQGKVLSVVGEDEGGGGVTTVTIGGPIEAADQDESFRWIWADADYGRWVEVAPPWDTVNVIWTDAYSVEHWDPYDWSDAQWEVRSDGELFIGTVRGATYRGDAWYRGMPRKRLAYVLDRTLFNWPSGDYAGMGAIAAIRFDYRANLGTYFRARVGGCVAPWVERQGESHPLSLTGGGAQAANDVEHSLAGYPCAYMELSLYSQYDRVAAGEYFQLLHPRVLVRPDGPGTRSWAVGDGLPRLDQCMTDVMVDGEGAIATSAEAEEIGDELEQAAVDGPTRSAALEQLAEYDEDEDGTGEPLEYGIWDGEGLHDYVAVVARRKSAPQRKDQWLAIDTDRDDVDVRIEYEDCEAPDFVEVRYAYRKTNLIRHSSPAAEGYWSDRGYADDLPYDWDFSQSGDGELSVITEDDQRRYKMDPGSSGQVQARFPKDGTYPIVATQLIGGAYEDEAVIPGIFDVPLRFQVWAKGRGTVDCMMRTYAGGAFNADPVLSIDDGDWQLHRHDWRPDPAGSRYELYIYLLASVAGEPLWWRNAQLYLLIPDGTELSAWYPYQPEGAGHAIKTYDLPFPATIWQARNSARKFYNSFARGRGRGTITARGILHDVRGREVPVSRIRGGWWASIVNDPRCEEPLYISGVSDVDPYRLESELCIGGETPPWSAREPLYERRTFGRHEDWRGFRPLGRRR